MTLYRKVYTKDRLPEGGWHDTNIGFQNYFPKMNKWTKSLSTFKNEDVEWWFEEVEVPTEDDITRVSSGCPTNERMLGFEDGANYILNKLKG